MDIDNESNHHLVIWKQKGGIFIYFGGWMDADDDRQERNKKEAKATGVEQEENDDFFLQHKWKNKHILRFPLPPYCFHTPFSSSVPVFIN